MGERTLFWRPKRLPQAAARGDMRSACRTLVSTRAKRGLDAIITEAVEALREEE